MRNRSKYRKFKKRIKRAIRGQKRRDRNINKYRVARGGIRL